MESRFVLLLFSLRTIAFFLFALHLGFGNALAEDAALVAIDPGHTVKAFGALSARGIGEYEFNRRIAGMLAEKLKILGHATFIINPFGDDISLKNRAAKANGSHASLFVSIHHDSVRDEFLKPWEFEGRSLLYCDEFHGFSVYFSGKNPEADRSRQAGELVGKRMREAGFDPALHHVEQEHRPIVDRRLGLYQYDDLVVLKNTTMPAILVECGVIVNRSEEAQLANPVGQGKIVEAIASGIHEFLIRDK